MGRSRLSKVVVRNGSFFQVGVLKVAEDVLTVCVNHIWRRLYFLKGSSSPDFLLSIVPKIRGGLPRYILITLFAFHMPVSHILKGNGTSLR